MAKVSTVIDTILAEAGGSTPVERLEDMKAIASVIANRAAQLGVSLEDVVSVPSEFNAYGKAFPPGVKKYRALAEQALKEVQENGPVHDATFYATPKAAHRLPDGLQAETETAGHQFFSDPERRSIRTAQGFVRPDAGGAMLASYAPEERLSAEPSAFDALFGGYNATPQQGFTGQNTATPQRGLLADRAGITSGLLGVEREGYGSPFGALGDRITSGFGSRVGPKTPFGVGSSNHRGVDLSLHPNTEGYPVEASAGGVVTYAGPRDGYGNMVQVQHPDGTSTRYGHLQEVGNVAIGDEIARGTPVGLLGNTGRSRGPHLHFETLDKLGNPVDPRTVVDFNPDVRVPTPEERPSPWESAVPMAVERESLPSLGVTPVQQRSGYGLLAETMGQTPGLNLSGAGVDLGAAGRMMDTAEVAQGKAGLRDAMFSGNSIGRASDAEIAEMQDEANRSRQALEAQNGGRLSLTADQQSVFADRRANALGLLGRDLPTQATAATATQPATMGGTAMTAGLVDPKDYPRNVAATERLTGLSPTMTQSVSVTSPTLGPDLSAPLADSDFMGFKSNPGLASANKFGMDPTGVKTVDVGLLSQPSAARAGVVEGPVSSADVEAQAAEAEQEKATDTQQQPSRFGNFARKAGASLLGGIAGSAVGGPIGGLIGTALARRALGVNKDQQQGGLLGGLGGLLGGNGRPGAWAGVGTLNDIGRGAQASYGAWGGPKGTTATATDGSRITSLGGGLVSRIDTFGRETLFRDGQTVGGGGGFSGGLLGGLFGGNSSGSSQADKARDSVGLY